MDNKKNAKLYKDRNKEVIFRNVAKHQSKQGYISQNHCFIHRVHLLPPFISAMTLTLACDILIKIFFYVMQLNSGINPND